MAKVNLHYVGAIVQRFATRLLIVAATFAAIGTTPCVGRAAQTESESPFEADESSVEAALTGISEQESRRYSREVAANQLRRDGSRQAQARRHRWISLSGYRLPNGLCAPLRC